MNEKIKNFLHNNSRFKKIIGVILILLGVVAGFLPFIPGVVLVVIGLELLGIHLLSWNKIKKYFKK